MEAHPPSPELRTSPWLGAVVVAVVVLAASPVRASTREIVVDIPDRREASYEMPFDVEHPGTLRVSASWPSGRVLWFRVEGPGSPPLRAQRSGPSPQRIQIDVAEETVAAGTGWKLSIRALPDRGAVRASVILELPEAHTEPPEPPASGGEPIPDSAPSAQPWLRPVATPRDSVGTARAMFDTLERFRSLVVAPSQEMLPDPCAWQSSFLRAMAGVRDGGAAPDENARGCFLRVGTVIRRVDELRISKDPALVGKQPEDPVARLAWRSRRNETVRPLEKELDDLQQAIRGGRCPEGAENWLPRLVACVTACERYFEGRPRLGEDDAPNRDLALDQWERILCAGQVLEAVGSAP